MASMYKSNDYTQSDKKDLMTKMLKEAGIAYAPLIFDLKPDGVTFSSFMSLCDTIWSHLTTQRNIGEKLLSIKDIVPKLEEIQSSSSNRQLSSVNQAKQFNLKGVYRVGNLTGRSCYALTEFNSSLTINDIIELECEMDIGKDDKNAKVNEKRVEKLNYHQLNELKNILMLMARKSTMTIASSQASGVKEQDDDSETLDYFIDVFDNVIRLAEIYLKLVEKGEFKFFGLFSLKRKLS
jgi:hypothetical protein